MCGLSLSTCSLFHCFLILHNDGTCQEAVIHSPYSQSVSQLFKHVWRAQKPAPTAPINSGTFQRRIKNQRQSIHDERKSARTVVPRICPSQTLSRGQPKTPTSFARSPSHRHQKNPTSCARSPSRPCSQAPMNRICFCFPRGRLHGGDDEPRPVHYIHSHLSFPLALRHCAPSDQPATTGEATKSHKTSWDANGLRYFPILVGRRVRWEGHFPFLISRRGRKVVVRVNSNFDAHVKVSAFAFLFVVLWWSSLVFLVVVYYYHFEFYLKRGC